MRENDLFDIHRPVLERDLWAPIYAGVVIKAVMLTCKPEIIRNWVLTGFAKDNTLAHWEKRFQPLTDEELKEFYNN